MPSVFENLESGQSLLRVLAYGKEKSRKTWWATAAAEANFNVLLLDGENGWDIARNLSIPAQKRIQVIALQEQTKKAIFAPFLTLLLKAGSIQWDTVEQKSANLAPNANTVMIDLQSRSNRDVLIIDSWTALCWSLQFRYAMENNIDLATADKDEWDFYGWGGRLATWFLKQMQTLPCHVIVIGHRVTYDKYKPKKKKSDKNELLYSRDLLSSTSNPHSMTIGANFSDILTFKVMSEFITKIEVIGDEGQVGGSRHINPGIYDWESLQFSDICKQANLSIPSTDNPLWDISVNKGGSNVENKTISAGSGTKLKLNKINL